MKLIELKAGPLKMAFDASNAFLRYVRLGDQELVRGVIAAIRDHNWDTISFSIDELTIQQMENSFSIAFVANSQRLDVPFVWKGSIEGTGEGLVRYHFDYLATATFHRNRIGLCVLHPSDVCAGRTCRVDHVDGSTSLTKFPTFVSPHQPFKRVRAITLDVEPNVQATVTLAGDTFETEDQRNWTDASFKTYSTPLDLPFPVQVENGTTIQQSVTIEAMGFKPHTFATPTLVSKRPLTDPKRFDIDWNQPLRRPAIGCQWQNELRTASKNALAQLRALGLDHLRCDVWLNQAHWHADLMRAVAVSDAIECKLELALFVDSLSGSRWDECLNCIEELQLRLARVLVLHSTRKTTPSEMVQPVHESLRCVAPNLQVVVGTNAYFAELNREPPSTVLGGKVCYSINPQVHAFDNRSLSETLSAQRETVNSAVRLFNTDVVISPVTFRPRLNPNATSTFDLETQLRSAIDPRQTTGFGAAWTVGVFSLLLTHPRVHSATLFEAFGCRGIIGADGREFPMTGPIAHILRSKKLFDGASSSSRELVGLGTASKLGEKHVVFGNLTEDEHVVHFRTPLGGERKLVIPSESVQIVRMEDLVDA